MAPQWPTEQGLAVLADLRHLAATASPLSLGVASGCATGPSTAGDGAPMATHAPVPGPVDVDAAWHAGNCDTAQRIALLERYLSLFGASSIRALLADREFIGAGWLKFLCENNVPFAIRLREDMQIRLADGRLRQFRSLLRKPRRGTWTGWLNGMDAIPANQLRVAAKRIKGSELLIVATNLEEGVSGLNLYRKRWGIECLFADAKTRGLNIEDTHITDPDKLATLLVVVALAVTWAHRCASLAMGRKAIRRKVHGRREKSWFRTGFDALRNWIIHRPGQAFDAWARTCPRRPFQPAGSA